MKGLFYSMDDLFDQFFNFDRMPYSNNVKRLFNERTSNANEQIIKIDLPGVKKEDLVIDADVIYNDLNLSWTRGAEKFERVITIDKMYNALAAAASLDLGVLTLVVPVVVVDTKEARRIQIS